MLPEEGRVAWRWRYAHLPRRGFAHVQDSVFLSFELPSFPERSLREGSGLPLRASRSRSRSSARIALADECYGSADGSRRFLVAANRVPRTPTDLFSRLALDISEILAH